MPKARLIYAGRRRLRAIERVWTAIERPITRLSALAEPLRPYNPFYHLGTIEIFLLFVLIATGVYLTILYRPGSDRAYQSVAAISATWHGSIMRGAHRYASDALILVAFLHAFKILVMDRFWGSRWLAWVSGWLLVVLFWLTGTMGFFLIWDQGAQWLTEYAIDLFGGSFALSFLGAQAASRTFGFFVIILFLHVFIPLLLAVAVLIHEMRLARARYWSPRWLMVVATLLLIALAGLLPVASAAPADLGRLVAPLRLDWWYMGFLPLSSWLGNPLFWLLSFAIIGLFLALPWLGRGQHLGPAQVIPSSCTGCALCARECPYDAIEMVTRDDETQFSSLAVVKPNLCTGCGVCVAACNDSAIELTALHAAVVRQDLRRTLQQASAGGVHPVVVFTCDRHAVHHTLPPLVDAHPVGAADLALQSISLVASGSQPRPQAQPLPARVQQGSWPDGQGALQPVMTAVLPCMGMLHPTWAVETIEAGASGAIMVTCPSADCAYREGPEWTEDRMKRRRTLRHGNAHLLELAPGSQAEVGALWRRMAAGKVQAEVSAVGEGSEARPSFAAVARSLLPGVALLLVVFLLSLAFNLPTAAAYPQQARLRLTINHSGQLLAHSQNLPPDVLAKLPKGVDPAAILGGERFPIGLRLTVDGQPALDRSYRPRGLRREGAIYRMEDWWLAPGAHQVEIQISDDNATWRTVFAQSLDIAPGETRLLNFDPAVDAFVARE